MKLAVSYGKGAETKHMKLFVKVSSAGRRCTRSRCSSPTCRRIRVRCNLVDDTRSELVIRC